MNHLRRHIKKNIGIIASQEPLVYSAIYSIWQSGQTYIPLNPNYPKERLQSILQQISLDVIWISPRQLGLISSELLDLLKHYVAIEVIDESLFPLPQARTADEKIKSLQQKKENIAYIIFTSGSSGEPKGVAISYRNLAQFLSVLQQYYQPNSEDRIAQFAQLSFDMSIGDLALAYLSDAPLIPVPQHELLSPVHFIARERISIWFSVPSIISRLMRLKLLKPNSFPSLRLSLFCGEVLSEQAVKAWQQAAPNSRIENLYGPTEATVACFNFTCGCSGESVVPIGRPFPGTLAAVVNEKFEFLTANQRGELLLAGAQVSPGYFLRPDLTAEKFITLMHPTLGLQRWYRTGDLVIQDQQQIFHYLARIDNQVKVAGFRIELEEVESHLKKLLVSDEVALTAIQYAGETRLVAVLCLPDINIAQIKSALKTYLPDYMIPHFWHVLPCLPYNQNDKIDRKQLNKCIQQIFAEPV